MPNSRGRKRQKPRTSRPSAPITWQAKVLADTRALLDPEMSRHEVELWASALLGECGHGNLLVRRHARDVWLAQMLQYAGRRRTPEAAAFVLALVSVCVQVPAEAETWARELLSVPWTDEPGLRPMALSRAYDGWKDHCTWFLEYTDHVLCITTSHGGLPTVRDLALLPSGAPTRWDALVSSEMARPREPVDVDHGLAELKRITDLQRRTFAWRDPQQRALAQLLEGRLQGARDEPPPVTAISEERRRLLVSAFAEEHELQHRDLLAEACQPLFDFAETYLDGDPLLWSPELVDVFLLEWMPYQADDFIDLLPCIPSLLYLWVRWALRKRGLADVLALAVVLVIENLRGPFLSACEDQLLELGYEPEEVPPNGRSAA